MMLAGERRRSYRPPLPLLLLMAWSLAACAADDTVVVATATARPASVDDPSPPAFAPDSHAPSPSPTPLPWDPWPTRFNEVGDVLMIELANENRTVGLVRSGFELTLFAEDGGIIEIIGFEASPGAPCCTIYQLPPGGGYGLAHRMDPAAPPVHSIQLFVPDEWVEWDEVDAPVVDLTALSVQESDEGPRVIGEATVRSQADNGPFQVWVVAIVDSASGFIVAAESIGCAPTGEPHAFEVTSELPGVDGPYVLDRVVAYTMTIPGVTSSTDEC